jgi:non-specific serine/threonine protein kinase/serine/threonine-protein kinase
LKLDVERAVRGEAVTARSGARMYQFGRFLRRYRWAAGAVVAVVLSLAIGLGAAAWQARRAQIERDAARRDAAREVAVRYQLTRLFRTAIEDRGANHPSAKAMIDGSAQRVLREYQDDPRLSGEIVNSLADLYGMLEDVQGGAALLDAFLKEANPELDAVDVADAQQKFAGLELARGRVQHAGELLTQAERFWASAPSQYAEERLEGLGIRARERRAAGDLDGAINTMRSAIPQRIALSGREHRETAVLYNSYAIILTAAHRLGEALDAYREALAIYRATGVGDELDAQIVAANSGILEIRTGHLQEAESTLRDAIQHQRELAGDSAAVASALGNYGKLFSITGRSRQALQTLSEATVMAARYAGPSSVVAVQNQTFLGEAQLGAGNPTAARATLAATREVAQAQYGADHPFTLRVELALARVMMAQGEDTQARTQLLAVIPLLRSHGAQTLPELAQALQTLGEVLVVERRAREAVVPLREAVTLGEQSGYVTWELSVARERLGEALAADGDAGAHVQLQQALTALERQFGSANSEVLRAQRALAASLRSGSAHSTELAE